MLRFLKFAGLFNLEGIKSVMPEKVDMKSFAKRFHEDETGQGMTEYIIIIVLVAIFVIAMVKLFGNKIKALFSGSAKELEGVGTEAGIEMDSDSGN